LRRGVQTGSASIAAKLSPRASLLTNL